MQTLLFKGIIFLLGTLMKWVSVDKHTEMATSYLVGPFVTNYVLK
ncbi:hypothetical protein PGH07_05235 [Sulfurovum sp. zt1-1]|uniref:Uncharacterized protein n=1 Tax=Sulfurovum zhangzhouensis TaxID=3019067 RepID=A0ABT7QXM2_9BACT|nr:hypothetical protein [Sulfurovum zhangzhouensis]MDM5271570.1 hypothetical protein [Sulfurovum zhangzhouensis]